MQELNDRFKFLNLQIDKWVDSRKVLLISFKKLLFIMGQMVYLTQTLGKKIQLRKHHR